MAVETAVQTPQDVEAMQRLSAAGSGRRRIAKELGCSPETARKYLRSEHRQLQPLRQEVQQGGRHRLGNLRISAEPDQRAEMMESG